MERHGGDRPSPRNDAVAASRAGDRLESRGLVVAASARRMNDRPFAPELMVAEFNAGDLAYVVVGGLALAAHGVMRASDDFDLVPEPTADNRDRVMAVLAGLGASIDATPGGLGLLRFRRRHGDIHVLDRVASAPPYAELMATPSRSIWPARRCPAAPSATCAR